MPRYSKKVQVKFRLKELTCGRIFNKMPFHTACWTVNTRIPVVPTT